MTPISVGRLVEALRHMAPPSPYTTQEFMRDLTQAKLSGDLDSVAAVRARGRAASVGFNSNIGRQKVDGVTYQNAMRDAW